MILRLDKHYVMSRNGAEIVFIWLAVKKQKGFSFYTRYS